MVNVYQQISSNKQQSFLIISLFVIFICLSAYLISVTFNLQGLLPLAILLSAGSALLSFYSGDQIVLSLNGAKPATRKDFFNFYTVTENLSLVNQTPVPKIYVIESPAMNAFATGRDPEHAVICATTGLLNQLDRTQLEGVIAHELSHIKNYDTRLMTIVSILIGTLSILTNLSSNSFFHRNRNENHRLNFLLGVIGIVLIVFAPIIAKLIQLAISRRREYFADSSAVMLTRQPEGLINALKKIASDSHHLQTASVATASLYITNPFKNDKFASLFSTHPPVEDRIQALESMK